MARTVFNPSYLCGYHLHICPTDLERDRIEDYRARLFASKPPQIKSNDFIDRLYDEIKNTSTPLKDRPKLRVMHVTDFHIDPEYQPGSKAPPCGAPICCRNSSGIPEDPS